MNIKGTAIFGPIPGGTRCAWYALEKTGNPPAAKSA